MMTLTILSKVFLFTFTGLAVSDPSAYYFRSFMRYGLVFENLVNGPDLDFYFHSFSIKFCSKSIHALMDSYTERIVGCIRHLVVCMRPVLWEVKETLP